jgi:hypothetical protein
MDNLCPFFKENCHGNECVMWKNKECLLVAFLQRIQESVPLSEENVRSPEEGLERTGMILHREEAEIPKWLKTSTPEELAVEMLEFKDKEFPKEEKVNFHILSRFFWENKGVERFFLPSEAQLKIERADYLAERQITKEEEAQKKKRLSEEKEELPSLVSQCVDWARINSLKRLTLADVDTYILEKDLDILPETKRSLYAMANLKLKTGK